MSASASPSVPLRKEEKVNSEEEVPLLASRAEIGDPDYPPSQNCIDNGKCFRWGGSAALMLALITGVLLLIRKLKEEVCESDNSYYATLHPISDSRGNLSLSGNFSENVSQMNFLVNFFLDKVSMSGKLLKYSVDPNCSVSPGDNFCRVFIDLIKNISFPFLVEVARNISVSGGDSYGASLDSITINNGTSVPLCSKDGWIFKGSERSVAAAMVFIIRDIAEQFGYVLPELNTVLTIAAAIAAIGMALHLKRTLARGSSALLNNAATTVSNVTWSLLGTLSNAAATATSSVSGLLGSVGSLFWRSGSVSSESASSSSPSSDVCIPIVTIT